MDNHGEKISPMPGEQYTAQDREQDQDQDAAFFAVSAASKTALELDETSSPTICLPGSLLPTQRIYTVGLGKESRRVWTLSDQVTMHLKGPDDWEQHKFWNSHIDFENVERLPPRKAFGSECGEGEYPTKCPPTAYPPGNLLREWHSRHCQSESGTLDPSSAHRDKGIEDRSGSGTSPEGEFNEADIPMSRNIMDNEVFKNQLSNGVPAVEVTTSSPDGLNRHKHDQIETGETQASEFDDARSTESEETSEADHKSSTNIAGIAADNDNNMDRYGTNLTTSELAEEQPHPRQDDTGRGNEEEDQDQNAAGKSSSPKRKKKKKNNKSTSEAVQPGSKTFAP